MSQPTRGTPTNPVASPTTMTSFNEGAESSPDSNMAGSSDSGSMTPTNGSGPDASEAITSDPGRTSSVRPLSIVSTGSVSEVLARDFAHMSLDATVKPLFSENLMSGIEMTGLASQMSGMHVTEGTTTPMSGIETADATHSNAGHDQSAYQQKLMPEIRGTMGPSTNALQPPPTHLILKSNNNGHMPAVAAPPQTLRDSRHAFHFQAPHQILFPTPQDQGLQGSIYAPRNGAIASEARKVFGLKALYQNTIARDAARLAGASHMPDTLFGSAQTPASVAPDEEKTVTEWQRAENDYQLALKTAPFPTRREGIAPYSGAPPSPPSNAVKLELATDIKAEAPVSPLIPAGAPMENVDVASQAGSTSYTETADNKRAKRLTTANLSRDAQQAWAQIFQSSSSSAGSNRKENRAPPRLAKSANTKLAANLMAASRVGILTATPKSIEASKRSIHRNDPVSEQTVNFTAWPSQRERDAPAAGIRRVRLTNLPTTASPESILSVVWGGKIETINYMRGNTWADVYFVNSEECKKYADAAANTLTWPAGGRNVWVVRHRDVDPVSSLLRSHLATTGASRCVRVVGVDKHLALADLERLAAADNRKVDKVLDGVTENKDRVVVFRFCNIQDAITFKGKLTRDENFEPCGIKFTTDPCEMARGVHN